ncbi:MAG: hypothetical protein PHU27_07240 [Salinivirgaceae bacterium]|nr:hypothetical protein [Salinivirgaceae bacterium]
MLKINISTKTNCHYAIKNGNVFLRNIGDGMYVEIAKYQEIQEKLRQYNSQFENANIGFIAGAGVFRVEGEGNVGKNSASNTVENSGNPLQTASDVNNYSGIFISAADQVIKNTKFGSNIAYAISGNSNLVSVVNNGLKFAPYAGLGITIYTGSLLSTEKNPATNQPYQSWFETGTDIGANLGIIYIGTQFGGWWGAGAATVYLGVKYTSKQQMNCYINNGMNPGVQFIFFKQ